MNIRLLIPTKTSLTRFGLDLSERGPVFYGAALAEEIRFQACAQYSANFAYQMEPYGLSRRSVISGVQRRLDLDGNEAMLGRLYRYFDTLLELEDIGKLESRKGYIPRESRITLIIRKWGRRSGGLPVAYNECGHDKNVTRIEGTFGNLVEVNQQDIPDSWEVRKTHAWETNHCEADFRRLLRSLEMEARTILECLEYYDFKQSPRLPRSKCWTTKKHCKGVTIARGVRNGRRQYFLCQMDSPIVFGVDITRSDALLFLLRQDLMNGRRIDCAAIEYDSFIRVRIPKYFPPCWEYALKAACLDYSDANSCIDFLYRDQTLDFIQEILNLSGASIIWLKH